VIVQGGPTASSSPANRPANFGKRRTTISTGARAHRLWLTDSDGCPEAATLYTALGESDSVKGNARMISRSVLTILALVTLISGAASLCPAQPNLQYATVSDAFLFLLREPAVLDDLRLSSQQRQTLAELNDRLDGPLLALRTWPADKANQKLSEIVAESLRETDGIFSRSQQQRLSQIKLRVCGVRCLQLDSVTEKLHLSQNQRRDIDKILADTRQAIDKLSEQAQDGGNRASSEQEHRRLRQKEQQEILALLSPRQTSQLTALLGPTFDTSRLSRVAFKAPELVEGDGWINSQPLRVADLRGEVVALHFWTFG